MTFLGQPNQIEILETAGPILDEAKLLQLRPHSTVSTGYVLRHHDQEIKWRYEGYGYYTASRGRAHQENENIVGVVASAGASSELSFVISFETEEVIETDIITKTVACIKALDPSTTTFSPTEISFLHLVVGWQYYTQTHTSSDSIERYLSDIIRELRTRRAHGQVLLPRFLKLAREAQYQMSAIWPEETESLTLEGQQSFAANRAALHLRATRDMESAGNIGGVPVDWKRVERGFEDIECREIIRGRPILSTESTPDAESTIQVVHTRPKLFDWSKDMDRDCPLSMMTPMPQSNDQTINSQSIAEVAHAQEGSGRWLDELVRQRILPTPIGTSTRGTSKSSDKMEQ